MNILELRNSFGHDGIVVHIALLSNGLSERGNKVVIASSEGKLSTIDYDDRIKHVAIRFDSRNPIQIIRNLFELRNLIKDENIEIVHCHHRMCAIYMQILRSFGMAKTPYVWTLHSSSISNSALHRMSTFYGERAIVVSPETKAYFVDTFGIPDNEVSVVINGIDLDKFVQIDSETCSKIRDRYALGENKVVTLLGNLVPVKDHETAIRAISNVSRGVELKLLLTGTGTHEYESRLQKLISDLNVEDRVLFTGHVDAREILSISDLVVLPSLSEGFPIAAIEAFAMKKPLIRTRTGGYSYMKEFCIGMEVGDAEFLAKAIEDVLLGRIDVPDMVKNAYKFVEEECTDEKVVENIYNLYKEVLTSTKK